MRVFAITFVFRHKTETEPKNIVLNSYWTSSVPLKVSCDEIIKSKQLMTAQPMTFQYHYYQRLQHPNCNKALIKNHIEKMILNK